MFTTKQLELLEELLEAHPISPLGEDQVRELRGAVQSAIWASSRNLSAADKRRIAEAEADGRVAILTHVHNAAEVKGGWTLASRISDRIANESKTSPVTQAKDGDELLAALGLD